MTVAFWRSKLEKYCIITAKITFTMLGWLQMTCLLWFMQVFSFFVVLLLFVCSLFPLLCFHLHCMLKISWACLLLFQCE